MLGRAGFGRVRDVIRVAAFRNLERLRHAIAESVGLGVNHHRVERGRGLRKPSLEPVGERVPEPLRAPARSRESLHDALRYEPRVAQSAPVVVASGRGALAEKILDVAFAHGVKVREDADLAEILAAVDIDSEIPVEAFVAVAEILRYVYAANGTKPPEISDP